MTSSPPNLNFSNGKIVPLNDKVADQQRDLFQELLAKLTVSPGKKSFLVRKNNKYINVLTKNIAFFYIKQVSAVIRCFDNQEYFVDYSLEQIEGLLPVQQFYRINRQYLINFNAVKEVEHYFSRKMLINPVIQVNDKLIVSKEKVSEFLHWLDNR
jgi:DNA-binding LytR/AlgR family response regulator